jgi:hypothetical protein
MKQISILLFSIFILNTGLQAQDSKPKEALKLSDSTIIEMPQIMIIGKRD